MGTERNGATDCCYDKGIWYGGCCAARQGIRVGSKKLDRRVARDREIVREQYLARRKEEKSGAIFAG
jgi:hypothetical protein